MTSLLIHASKTVELCPSTLFFRIGAITQQTLTFLMVPDLCHSNKCSYVLLSGDYNLFRALSDLTSRTLPRASLKSSMPAALACLGNRTAQDFAVLAPVEFLTLPVSILKPV